MRVTTKRFLLECLNTLIKPESDIVFIHSSILKLAKYEGGIEKLLNDIIEYYGDQFTIGMPTFTFKPRLKNIWMYDDNSEMGSLTQALLRHPDSSRSIHPTHSCAFIGKRSAELSSVLTNCVFEKNGIFDILFKENALNIGLGSEFIGSATCLHLAEKKQSVWYRETVALNTVCQTTQDTKPLSGFTYFARKKNSEGKYFRNDWNKAFYKLVHHGKYHIKVNRGLPLSSMHMSDGITFIAEALKNDENLVLGNNNE